MPDSAHPEKFYVTTPIYYVNARPHIGHAYSTIVADVLARRHRLLGHDTYFLTGTDEHGQKIERSAAAAGIPPQEFADRVSKTFSDLWERMGITNDDFIRTTEPRHKRGVQKLFQTLYDAGHIYLSTYTGQYSIGEEMFVEGPPGTIGPDGRPTETVTEENFFFRLSAFQSPLLDLIEGDALRITPESSKNEVLSFLRGYLPNAVALKYEKASLSAGGQIELLQRSRQPDAHIGWSERGEPYVRGVLKDLSISRSSFTWGIPVPEAVQLEAGTKQPHVIYVWLDALANYMTAIGYGSDLEADEKKFENYWPATLHVVGKEITRFHCVYWPAFLLALNPKLKHNPDEPMPTLTPDEHKEWASKWLPEAVTANGWLLFDNSKMSKSKGNVVRTETILEGFGEHVYGKQFPESTKVERDLFAADVLRYYLLREIPFGQDGSFSFASMWERYNSSLTNGYGNLVSRTFKMISDYFGNVVPIVDEEVLRNAIAIVNLQATFAWKEEALAPYFRNFDELQLDRYLQGIEGLISVTDETISLWSPWKKRADESETTQKREYCLYYAWEMIRIITALFYPIMPFATGNVWRRLGLGDIEQAASDGELRHLRCVGLRSGTKIGPLTQVFPRADKSLVGIMEELEVDSANSSRTGKGQAMPTEDTSQQPALPDTHPAAPLKGATTPAAASAVAQDSSDPAAPPRTSSLETENPGGRVGGSHAVTTEREGTPPHGEAAASGIFAGQGETAQIAIDDFTKIDLRVAKILVAERIPKADKLLRLEVDLGYEQRQILSGIAEWYAPEELVGRKIVIIANLAPRKMRGLESRGMLLAASEGENGKPVLATFGEEIAVGTRLR